MRKFLTALTIGLAAIAAPTLAHAQEAYSLHLQPGIVQPLTRPQSDIYNTGLFLDPELLFNLSRNVLVGPSAESMYLPRAMNTDQAAGMVWELGGNLRVQGSHAATFSPWIDGNVSATYTGHLPLLGLGVRAGLDMPVDSIHQTWFGPFLGYEHIFQTANQTAGSLLDKNDVNVFEAGLSLSFDFPVRQRVVNHNVVRVKKEVVVNTVPVAVPVMVQRIAFTEHVYFDWDKSVLRWESKDKLDEVAEKLKAVPDLAIKVQGHASSDGQKAHNEKLAADRTAAVVDYLVSKGISRDKLVSESFGVDKPAAPNTTQEGRERNRRVEFTVDFTSVQK